MATPVHECWVCGKAAQKIAKHDGHDICVHCEHEVTRLAEGLLKRAIAHMRHRRMVLEAAERRKTLIGAA